MDSNRPFLQAVKWITAKYSYPQSTFVPHGFLGRCSCSLVAALTAAKTHPMIDDSIPLSTWIPSCASTKQQEAHQRWRYRENRELMSNKCCGTRHIRDNKPRRPHPPLNACAVVTGITTHSPTATLPTYPTISILILPWSAIPIGDGHHEHGY